MLLLLFMGVYIDINVYLARNNMRCLSKTDLGTDD